MRVAFDDKKLRAARHHRSRRNETEKEKHEQIPDQFQQKRQEVADGWTGEKMKEEDQKLQIGKSQRNS